MTATKGCELCELFHTVLIANLDCMFIAYLTLFKFRRALFFLTENLLKKRRMFQEWEDTPDLIEADEIQRYMLSHLSLEDCTEDVLGFWRDHVTISLSSRCWQERCFAFLQPGHQASALSVQQVACWKRVAIG